MTTSMVLISAMVSAGLLSGQSPEPVSDLELNVVVETESITPPGSTGRLTFTVTNHGPDQAGSLADDFFVWSLADSFPFSVNYGALIIFTPVPETTCRLGWTVPDPIPGDDPVIFYFFWFFELQPGESVECVLDFRVNPFAEFFADGVTIPNTWRVRIFRGTDPNPANDEITLIFRLMAASDIPVLSRVGLVVLILSIMSVFLRIQRRRIGGQMAHDFQRKTHDHVNDRDFIQGERRPVSDQLFQALGCQQDSIGSAPGSLRDAYPFADRTTRQDGRWP